MDAEEVEKWIETEEGKKWIAQKTSGLVAKRDELLNEVAKLKKRLGDAEARGNAFGLKMGGYLARMKADYVSSCFDDYDKFGNRLLANAELREFVLGKIERLAEDDGGLIADIDESDGGFSYKTADGKDFAAYYAEWLGTESAKAFISNPSTGGGAMGSDGGGGAALTRNRIESMSPQEVADNLGKPEFRRALNQN